MPFYHAPVRCFVALDLPPPVRNHLAGLAPRFGTKGQVKWVPADQLHLTLVFAGDLERHDVDGLCDELRTMACPRLSLHLEGLGHFPPRGEPRVVWAQLGGDVGELEALYEEVAERAERHGVPRDKRGFVPHVTLGRVHSRFGAYALIDALKEIGNDVNPKPFSPTALVLYQSDLRPTGPIHTPMVKVPAPAAE